ncbi:hypothetical protein ACFU5O_09860 [Streptomyces sp. NPDC057445]|uniref:hypothetical protein n=1 Tax=Streptomyces sp. NPDC057445 TaxID=3346136 RepID=UPI0036B14AC4
MIHYLGKARPALTAVAAQPASAMRFVRGAARRYAVRAAQVLLFVGGLVVLGFVLGGQAHAAEKPGGAAPIERVTRTEPAGQLRDAAEPVAERVAKPVVERVKGVSEGTVAEPVASAGAAVADRIVRPVAEPVQKVVGGAVEDLTQTVPERSLPAPSAQLPGGLPAPGEDRPQDTGPAAVHHDEPRADGSAPAPTHDRPRAHTASYATEHLVPGPYRAYAAPVASMRPVLSGPFDGPLPFVPGRAPAAPGGSAVLQTAADGHTQRAGDPQCAWFSQAVAFGLVPGARQPATGAGVLERHRDILEFPG